MNNEITVLRGPDRIRKRPAVVFTDDGIVGTTNAVKSLLRIFVGEAALGKCSKISFFENQDGSFTVESFDKGFALGEKTVEGKPLWYYDFCEFFVPDENPDDQFIFDTDSPSLYGENEEIYQSIAGDPFFDITCVQFATEFFNVEVLRNNTLKKLNFKKGYPRGELVKAPSKGESYTKITFKLDSEVFKTSEILRDEIVSFLQITAASTPNLICEYTDIDKTHLTFNYPNGILDYIANHPETKQEIFENEIGATGKDRYNRKDYSANLKVYVAPCKWWGFTLHIHNHERVDSPLSAPEKSLIKYFNWQIGSEANKKTDDKTVKENFCLILESKCENTATLWETARKQKIANTMLINMSEDILNDDFGYWLKKNKETILKTFSE